MAAVASGYAQPAAALAAAADGVHVFDLSSVAAMGAAAPLQALRRQAALRAKPRLLQAPSPRSCVLAVGGGSLFAGGVLQT